LSHPFSSGFIAGFKSDEFTFFMGNLKKAAIAGIYASLLSQLI
jgi:hypothetical protein